MFSIFGRPKPCRVMTALMDTETSWHISKLARTSDSTYVYVTGLVSKLAKNGLVMVEPKGKKRIVTLTGKGREVAHAIYELMGRLED